MTCRSLIKQSGVEISIRTCARPLEEYNIKKWVVQARPKLTDEHSRKRLAFARKYEGLYRKARGWVFRTPQEKWDPKMSIFSKGKALSRLVMVWAGINDACKRSEFVIMERDPESKRGGYSTKPYIATHEQGDDCQGAR